MDNISKEYLIKLLEKGKRIDGRALDELRPIEAKAGISSEDQILEIIDIGAEDVEEYSEEEETHFLIYTSPTDLTHMSNLLTQSNYKVFFSEIVYKPVITSQIKDKETADKVISFTEKLENMDDIQKVYANFEISEELIN